MKKYPIDFRSDTVTVPTPEMLGYMSKCEFGDDVFQGDPTARKLETTIADIFGKEDGLFVCTGTMGNQISCRLLVSEPTHQFIVDRRCHIVNYELGGVAFHTGCSLQTINPKNGMYLTAEEVESHIFVKNDWHHPITKVICLENTIQGNLHPIEEIRKIYEVAKKYDMKMHLDGARIWNANVASGVSMEEYGRYFDTISVCLSKGLGAPIGSVIVSTKENIAKARRYRKLYGGGWRQAGVLAGCALWCLENNWEKIKYDHDNAKYMAKELTQLGLKITNDVQTNWVVASTEDIVGLDWEIISQAVRPKGIILMKRGLDKESARLVCHVQITRENIDFLISEIKVLLRMKKKKRKVVRRKKKK